MLSYTSPGLQIPSAYTQVTIFVYVINDTLLIFSLTFIEGLNLTVDH